jgi:cytochrome c oxidase cbb3-type subunit 2
MPSYRFLCKVVDKVAEDDVEVHPGKGFGPETGHVVATDEALALAKYLLALDHTYPAPTLPKPDTEKE